MRDIQFTQEFDYTPDYYLTTWSYYPGQTYSVDDATAAAALAAGAGVDVTPQPAPQPAPTVEPTAPTEAS